jgi:hypothetical protein
MIETPYRDRNGQIIKVGDSLKWIRDDEFFNSGSKAGQLKQAGAEFAAGIVVKLPQQIADLHGVEYWCKAHDSSKETDPFSGLPSGLRFSSMLSYIEVVQK